MSDIPMILTRVGTKMAAEVSQIFEGHYGAGSILMSGLLSTMAGEAFDGAVDRLVREIEIMAELLNDGGCELGDITWPSLKISDLQPIHDRLAGALIALQVRIEVQEGSPAKALNARIWAFYAKSTTERMPTPPDFSAERAAAAQKDEP